MSEHRPGRNGGANLWTDEEMRTLEGSFSQLTTRFDGRSRLAIAHRILKTEKERAEAGADQQR